MLARYTLLDFETVAAPDALQWLPPVLPDLKLVAELEAPVEADKRLTDSVKIAADIAKKQAVKAELPARIEADIAARTATLLSDAALDPDSCRVVCAGFQEYDSSRVHLLLAPNEQHEVQLLETVWQRINSTTPMLGYGVSFFDAGVLVRRSQLLDVQVPAAFYRQGKYRHDWIVDLADFLTLNGMIPQKRGRGLDYHCQRLGIHVEDAYTGKDVAQLWADGKLEGIKAHCQADLARIRQLAERLGVIPARTDAGVICGCGRPYNRAETISDECESCHELRLSAGVS